MDNIFANAIFGGGSFLLPLVAKRLFGGSDKIISELISAIRTKDIKEKEHDLRILKINTVEKENARNLVSKLDRDTIRGSFLGRTRRRLALTFPLYLFLILFFSAILMLLGIDFPIVMPYQTTTSILGIIHRSSYEVLTLHGAFWAPWMQQLFFMVFGFYFGFETVKHI